MGPKQDQNSARQTLFHVWQLGHEVWCELQRAWAAQPLWLCEWQPRWPLYWAGSCSFPGQMSHTLGISVFLNLPLHPHSIMLHSLRGCLQGVQPCHLLPGLPESMWRPSDLSTLIFYRPAKTASIEWCLRLLLAWSVAQSPCALTAITSECWGSSTWENTSLNSPGHAGYPGTLCSKQSIKWVKTFTSLILMGGIWSIPEMP
jgi:hypothetical protein